MSIGFLFLISKLGAFVKVDFPPAFPRISSEIMRVPLEYTPRVWNYKQPADASANGSGTEHFFACVSRRTW
jgi:hypothetical protein